MSQISTTPVVNCKGCGRPLVVTQAYTFAPDETKEQLYRLMATVLRVALCEDCNRRRQYYISQGREEDFLNGRP